MDRQEVLVGDHVEGHADDRGSYHVQARVVDPVMGLVVVLVEDLWEEGMKDPRQAASLDLDQ